MVALRLSRPSLLLLALGLVAGCTRSGYVGHADLRPGAADLPLDYPPGRLEAAADRPGSEGELASTRDQAAPPTDLPRKDLPPPKKDLPPQKQDLSPRDLPRDLPPKDLPPKDLPPPKKDLPPPDTFLAKDVSGGPISPNGAYSLTPAVTYQCAFGVVSFNISVMTFLDDGAHLTVTTAPTGPKGGCSTMVGNPVAKTGAFAASCTYSGACTETYSLTGTFVGSGIWTGTYTAGYTGSCFGCTDQAWPVTGTLK